MRWCWVNVQWQGVLLLWIIVGQGLTALAVGAGGGCLDIFFSRLSFLSSSSLSLGDGRILTEILSDRNTVSNDRSAQNNQPTETFSSNSVRNVSFHKVL